MTTGLPFDDFRSLLHQLPGPDEMARQRVADDFSRLDQPPDSLGRVEAIAGWLAAWSGRAPAVNRPLVAVFAGNHGVMRHGVSPRPMSDTARIVELCAAGGAAINQLCLAHDLGLKVFDLALDLPTGDITQEVAMDERGCAATMAFGMEAISGTDLLCIGAIGVGDATVAATVLAALHGGRSEDWIAQGTDAEMVASHQAQLVDKALRFHENHLDDPLEVLRRLSGREFAAIAGAILAARMQKLPVILDGYAAFAAAAVLHAVNPRALDHCLLAHLPAGPGYAKAAETLGLTPLFGLGLNHGEGTGAALAAGVVKAAALCHSGMMAAAAR